jgi:CheY-like chemotaxis protein
MVREIFVVDDNIDYQFIFFKILKGLEKTYPVKFFESAKACHQHIETLHFMEPSPMPGLVILDFNMPGINGLQLLKMLKSSKPDNAMVKHDIPVVIMSNDFSDYQVQQCYLAGANAVILKPFEYQNLRNTIQSICKFWLDRDES